MLKKKTIKEEDTEGNVLKTSTRYDGKWKRQLEGSADLRIVLGDEEVLNTTINVPSKKALHISLSIAGVIVDKLHDV